MTEPTYDICLIGLGPAGLGFIQTLLDDNFSGKILCIEAGRDLMRKCGYLVDGECQYCNPCNVISGIGGCSIISSEKLSDYPAGSGFSDFFSSDEEAQQALSSALNYIKQQIPIEKYPIDKNGLDSFGQTLNEQDIFLKYYDVYTFKSENLIAFYRKTLDRLQKQNHVIELETEATSIIRLDSFFKILSKNGQIFHAKKIIYAGGKLGNNFLNQFVDETMECKTDNSYDIGMRLEFPTEYIEPFSKLHGDIKLKLENARTYCFSIDGKVAQYHIDSKYYTEGFSSKDIITGYSNLSILFRVMPYDSEYENIKRKMLLHRSDNSITKVSYAVFSRSDSEFTQYLKTILSDTFIQHMKKIIHTFVNVLFDGKDMSMLNVYFPELDLIETKTNYDTTFEVSKDVYIIGASTGVFRGILQAFASGQQCAIEMLSNKRAPRYIYDALYGSYPLEPDIVPLLSTPELQRLREVRLCNINCLTFTGASNINRYEHSLGTYHLAQVCIDENSSRMLLSRESRTAFLQAALLHDIANGPFGHSYEYLLSSQGYNPESGFAFAVLGATDKSGFKYKTVSTESIFWGVPRKIATVIGEPSVEMVGEIVDGRTLLGKILADKIDLDNIDNVYRMAYHMGLNIDKSTPEKLARAIIICNEKIVFKEEAVPFLWDWYYVREKMYTLLLLNPDEFSAKCMLTEALDIASKDPECPITWTDTDYELLLKLMDKVQPQKIQVEHYENTIDLPKEFKPQTDKELLIYIDSYYENNYKEQDENGKCGKNRLFKDGLEKGKIDEDKSNENEIIVTRGTGKIVVRRTQKTSEIELIKYLPISLEPKKIIERLMMGKLYGCIGIYTSANCDLYELFLNFDSRLHIEVALSKELSKYLKFSTKQKGFTRFNLPKNINIALHPIIDSNKTRRQFTVELESGKIMTVGKRLDRLLIGVFVKNDNWPSLDIQEEKIDTDTLNKIEEFVYNYFANNLFNQRIRRVPLYGETKCIML